MIKPKEIWIWDTIFQANVYVIIGINSGDKVEEWFKKNRDIDYKTYGDFGGRCITVDHGMNVYIFLGAMDMGDPTDMANFVHEAFHACHMILSLRGQNNQDDSGEEAHAYVLGWIVREVLLVLSKRPKRRTKNK